MNREEILKQLAAAGKPVQARSYDLPPEMQRGDMSIAEWRSLSILLRALRAKADEGKRLSSLEFSLFVIIESLAIRGFARPDHCWNMVVAGHGNGNDARNNFKLAVAIVWASTNDKTYLHSKKVPEAIRDLLRDANQ